MPFQESRANQVICTGISQIILGCLVFTLCFILSKRRDDLGDIFETGVEYWAAIPVSSGPTTLSNFDFRHAPDFFKLFSSSWINRRPSHRVVFIKRTTTSFFFSYFGTFQKSFLFLVYHNRCAVIFHRENVFLIRSQSDFHSILMFPLKSSSRKFGWVSKKSGWKGVQGRELLFHTTHSWVKLRWSKYWKQRKRG